MPPAGELPLASEVRSRLSPARWRHSLSVAETAGALAGAFGWPPADRERAILAGLLHDIAKELAPADQRALAGAGEGFTTLLHARAGAALARTELGVTDAELLEAIAHHPTARAGASPLLQVLFAVDYLEPGRAHLGDDERALLARAMAGEIALDALFCEVLRRKLRRVEERGLPVHPDSVAAWNAHCGAARPRLRP